MGDISQIHTRMYFAPIGKTWLGKLFLWLLFLVYTTQGQAPVEAGEDYEEFSHQSGADKWSGKMNNINEQDVDTPCNCDVRRDAACTDSCLATPGGCCGMLRQVPPTVSDCTNLLDDSCQGDLVPADEDDSEECTEDSFNDDSDTCSGELIPLPGDTCEEGTKDAICGVFEIAKVCFTCGGPLRLDNNDTEIQPKKLCDGEGSFKTVYKQRCKVRDDGGGLSSCSMGSEGFSFCNTEHLFWRDDHWFDWDLCSLCTMDDEGPLTTSGHLCTSGCNNRWNNKESLAPRCKVNTTIKERGLSQLFIVTEDMAASMDYCTTCEGDSCPNNTTNPSDTRLGSEVGHIVWQAETSTETSTEATGEES